MRASILLACFLSVAFTLKAKDKDTAAIQAAPKIAFQNCLDKPLNPDFYKGKFLILDFWATWCAPCIAGFTHFNELADKYGSANVIFASITEEPVRIEQKFFMRTRKPLHALRLSDTSKSTFNNFKISAIPHCYVIGPDNTIRWEGASYDLTANILDKILHDQSVVPVRSVSPLTHLSVQSKKPPRPLLYFNIYDADTSKAISETQGSWAAFGGVMTSYSSPKVYLGDFIQALTGLSASSRILSNDMAKLQKPYHLEFTVGANNELYKSFTDAIFLSSPRKNYILSTIGSALRFEAKPEIKKVKHFELIITDTAKLYSFRSMQERHSSMDDDHLPKLEIIGYNLNDIAGYIETSSKMIVSANGLTDKSHYDVSLDVADTNSLRKSLRFYGLDLKEVYSEVEFLSINFY